MALQQLRLVPSGVQAWYRDTITTSSDAFAYSSTMALHIFRLKDNTLHKIIAAHERTIRAICWSPEDSNLLASCSSNGDMSVWDIENEESRYSIKVGQGQEVPQLMDWSCSGDKIFMALDNGEVRLWEFKEGEKMTKLLSLAPLTIKVLRCHPRCPSRLLLGASDGSLLMYDLQTGKKQQISGKAKTSKDAVTDVQWDPLSEDYFLAAFQDGSLTLYDSSTQREIHSFEKQPHGIKSLAWAKSQPGNFITTTDRTGVLRMWNVSQKAPIGLLKVSATGIYCIKAIPSEPNWFLLSLKNGAVGVCDIELRKMRYMSCPGHSETIFDVVFHPNDPNVLATASYDGHVKLWNINGTENLREMWAGKDQLLYGLSFGPGATRICAVSNSGKLFMWQTDTGEELLRLQVHNGQSYRCEWNVQGQREGTGQIATGGADNFGCVVDAASGQVTHRIPHPAPVVGVSWHPQQAGVLATACQDGNIRIFNILQTGVEVKVQATLSGHEAKVFNIAFHPVVPDIIASGSDDKTVRVWNWSSSNGGPAEWRRLVGHQAYVRALLWHSELPNILFSGSWDASLRVWDVSAGQCLHVANEHYADVYGLALHPQRPFLLASTSRDTTLRFWSFEAMVRPLVVQALVRPDTACELLGSGAQEAMGFFLPDAAAAGKRQVKLYGQASANLCQAVAALAATKPKSIEVYQKIVSFFLYRQGIEDLWGLLAIIRGEQSAGASANRSVFHEQELVACQKSKALELASTRVQMGLTGKQEERLLKAAQIMLRIGDLRSYCRYTAQAGLWERAICIAPAVSRQFWQEMCTEYMESLSATNIEEVAPFWIATGQSERLINSYMQRGELDSSFVVAKASSDGLLPQVNMSEPAVVSAPSETARARLEDVAAILAARYADAAEPLQAALCFLAVSNAARSIGTLLRAHEVILAFVITELAGFQHDPAQLKLLAQSAERDQRWVAAASIFSQHPQGQTMFLPLLAARAPAEVVPSLGTFLTAEQHKERLASALAQGDRAAAILSAVCAGECAQAVRLSVEGLHELFVRPTGWTIPEARALFDPVERIPVHAMGVQDIADTLSCAAYIGLVEASSLGYTDMIFPLAQTLRNIVTHQNLSFPVSMAEITFVEAAATVGRSPSIALKHFMELLAAPDLPEKLRPLCDQHIAAIQQHPAEQPRSEDHFTKMVGANLPCCYKRHAKISILTSNLIKGPTFELEDGKQYIALADAFSWTRVNAFSPLNTGCNMSPI